jgi:hypothetical protein
LKIVVYIARLFKGNKYTSLFSSALDEAIKDTFKEMGYGFNNDDRNKKNKNVD